MVKAEIVAKKRFGQNFLKDEVVLEKIIKSIPNDNTPICEIGAGLGDLTRKLLELSRVIAFEIDRELFEILSREFAKEIGEKRLEIILCDVLDLWRENLHEKPYRLVANLPYYVATNIILKALKDSNCKELVVMIQKEVALKFCAKRGDRNFCALSVLVESAGEAEMLFDVPPSSFEPEPKVFSSVIRVRKRAELESSEDFERFLRVAFASPRKKLSKSLSQRYSKERISELFLELGIDDRSRAHEIPTILYHQIYNSLR